MYFKTMLNFFNNKLQKYFYAGVEKEALAAKRKFVIVLNRIAFATFIVLLISAVFVFIFTKDYTIAILGFCLSPTYLIPIYFSKKGKPFSAKVFMVVYTNISVIAFASLFAHTGTMFANYYFAIIAGSFFLYSYKERKWLFFSTILSLLLYVLESTSFFQFIPPLFKLENIHRINIIGLFSHVMMILAVLLIFLQTTKERENELLLIQQKILASEHKLKIQNNDLETFSIAASHCLQTPIYVSKFLLNKLNEQDNEALSKKNIEIIKDCLNQMEQLVSGLFSYNQIINIQDEYATFSIADEFSNIKKTIVEKYSNGLIYTPARDSLLTTNKLLFTIIIQNLIENGLKYNKSAIPEVSIEYIIKDSVFSLIVKDNGIGINKIYFDKIFEPFKKLNNQNLFIGTGLGLSGAKRAAEKIGGQLFCKDSSLNGSTFQLDLPYTIQE